MYQPAEAHCGPSQDRKKKKKKSQASKINLLRE